jgi:deazaflavin-dependent oxidoreductase (nitroreductase family)
MSVQVPPRGSHGRKLPRAAWMLLGAMPAMYRVLGGVGMGSTLVLTTVGAKSGKTRDVVLTAFEDQAGWLVVASKGGDACHPDWFWNLAAHPGEAWVQVGVQRMLVRAATLKDADYAAAWTRITGERGIYADYARLTDRAIPIVRLSAVEVIKEPVLVPAVSVLQPS